MHSPSLHAKVTASDKLMENSAVTLGGTIVVMCERYV